MIRYDIVASGSKGNATLLSSGTTLIQIDMGVSLSRLENGLANLHSSLFQIQALLITHEHSDHIKGLSLRTYQKAKIPLYCTAGTVDHPDHLIVPDEGFFIGDFSIFPFSVSHDATNPVGFVFQQGKEKLVYLTDSGIVPETALPYLSDADYYIVESNHDVDRLLKSSRPLLLKERIRSSRGHLSNDQSAEAFVNLVGPHTKSITLAHLSEECNTPELAITTWETIFQEHGKNVKQYHLRCASQHHDLEGGDL